MSTTPPTGPGAVTAPPLLIYVNVPFCNSKCHFCDWVTEVPLADLRLTPETSLRQRYIKALVEQIETHAPTLNSRGYRPRIMYWGGGTASILTLAEIEAVTGALHRRFDLGDLVEATIEGSPESMDPEKLRLFRAAGFNRISIGVQSFDDTRLRRIGRVHNAEQAERAVLAAAESGFENINIDLIVGFPGQEVDEVERMIRHAVTLPVNHFSVYPYRPTNGTVMRKQVRRGTSEIDVDEQLRSYVHARDLLARHGFDEYATAYFGAPRCESDEVYYKLTMDWIGFGSGANSLIGGRFLLNERGALHRFSAAPQRFDSDTPAYSPHLVLHFLAQALTTVDGMDARTFQLRTGRSLRAACEEPAVRRMLEQVNRRGRLIVDKRGIRLHRDDMASAYITMNSVDLYAATEQNAG
ncbi:coproporphyrinogen-III oxidase family protein [Lentzea sp. NEAU-D7]|uniref:coproporphyrinogen-III oxidase family protein n=1 Tax=Lentzea sp. NEAU-D7 TaxID=2994667 RepID=UPI00224A9CFE|nr:coproporphyrinogen-III oxidase family protein [Lentzea sp. NEAU-D7]MCX2951560.1 coproporphyrinogen-III oxidase family protein [Lentzea sp. NEAU-D7]